MAELTIYGDAADAVLKKNSTTSWTACQAATPTVTAATSQTIGTERNFVTPNWMWIRAFHRFDVTPFQAGGAYAGATITAVSLHVYLSTIAGTTAATCYYHDWDGDLAAGDWPSSLGTAATASQAFSSAYSNKEISMINLSSLLTCNGGLVWALDDESTEPFEENRISLGAYENATENRRPHLVITYTPAAASIPTILAAQSGSNINITWL